MLGPANGTNRRCGLGVGVVSLEEICHCGHGLWHPPPSCPEVSLLLAAFDQNGELTLRSFSTIMLHVVMLIAMITMD